jgi:hypothetical protein
VFADGLRQTDKWGETAAERFADEPVDQHGHVFDGEAGLEDRAECFLERVGAPYLAARSGQLAQGGGLLIVEAFGCFEQRPARFIEPAGGVAVADSTRAEHARIGGLEQPLTYGPKDESSTPSPSVSASPSCRIVVLRPSQWLMGCHLIGACARAKRQQRID